MNPFVEFLLKWLYLSSLLSFNRKELISIPQPQQHQLQGPVTPKLHFSSPLLCDWQRSALFSFACHPSPGERFQAVDEARAWSYRELEYKLSSTSSSISQQQQQLQELYDYLPQFLGVVLHSPHYFASMATTQHSHTRDPIFELRSLLLKQCKDDPNMGISLCWLLEAELGRAWKTLFEHMEQTGRSLRFVFIGPAAIDEGLLLAKIGIEKKAAFYLLRDARMATAFGYLNDGVASSSKTSAADRRCSHFWDTMQFIDQISQISLDLRNVPVIYRERVLQENLAEMNRRVRRRMITQGRINLDVEDGCSPFDRPLLSDISMDMLRYSIHFPMQPKRGRWPCGESTSDTSLVSDNGSGGVVRVLNIIEPECRLLSSRERCPFLIRMEVLETGLEGNDPMLYDQSDPNSSPKETTKLSHLHISGGMQSDDDFLNFEHRIFHSYHYEQSYRQPAFEELAAQFMHGASVADELLQHEHTRLPMGSALLDKIYGAKWSHQCERIRKSSPFGRIKGWKLASFIMKAGEDIRREALVMQIITKLEKYFDKHLSPWEKPYLRPYTVMCVGGDSGLLECVPDCKNIDEVKKDCVGFTTLREYFERAYGPPKRAFPKSSVDSQLAGHPPTAESTNTIPPPPSHAVEIFESSEISFEQAQDNFLRSLVGYSLVCYILQIKDRHNANILLCRDGHLMHIDFGFLLGETPKMGKVPIFSERAPFKLTAEFWDVLGGWNIHGGGLGVRFCKMLENAFAVASDYSDEISALIEAAVLSSTCSPSEARAIAEDVRSRLRMRGARGSKEQQQFIKDLVHTALNSWETSSYDLLQKSMNGYQC